MEEWSNFIFNADESFEKKAWRIFNYQFSNSKVYRRYCEALGINPDSLSKISQKTFGKEESKTKDSGNKERERPTTREYPLLPIKAFKEVDITTQPGYEADLTFKSSGTSAMQRSRHHVMDSRIYRLSLLQGFRQFYNLNKSVIWGYMPGYSSNPHSSLIYMLQELILQDKSKLSRFLRLNEPPKKRDINRVRDKGKKLILFGAAFGLIDLVEQQEIPLPDDSIVIETGGMKTHRREMSRKEMHRKLAQGFHLDPSRIHSEYGMAELLSQAYATGSPWFRTPPWMKVSIRDPENPFEELPAYSEGLVGVVDLANVHSCSFLLTGDRGKMDKKERFQVLGRWNPKDLRGCNFLVEED